MATPLIIALTLWLSPALAVWIGYLVSSRKDRRLDRRFFRIIHNEWDLD